MSAMSPSLGFMSDQMIKNTSSASPTTTTTTITTTTAKNRIYLSSFYG